MTPRDTSSVTVERDLPHPPEKIWRALTTPHLIEAWLMRNDFRSAPGDNFTLSADWGEVQCKVLTSQPGQSLSYSWASMGLETIVTWTLTPTKTGTRLQMTQEGFRPDQRQAFGGAKVGWQRFLSRLEQVLASGA